MTARRQLTTNFSQKFWTATIKSTGGSTALLTEKYSQPNSSAFWSSITTPINTRMNTASRTVLHRAGNNLFLDFGIDGALREWASQVCSTFKWNTKAVQTILSVDAECQLTEPGAPKARESRHLNQLLNQLLNQRPRQRQCRQWELLFLITRMCISIISVGDGESDRITEIRTAGCSPRKLLRRLLTRTRNGTG